MRISDWSSDVCSSDLLDLAFSIGRLEPRLEEARNLGGDEPGWPDIVVYTYLLWAGFASPRSQPELVNPVRTWFERLDADWRAVCLAPTVPMPAAESAS